MNKNILSKALDGCIAEAKTPHLTADEIYIVMPERDSMRFELVLADAGQAGHDAIERAYPGLSLSLDRAQLIEVAEQAIAQPVQSAGLNWFQQPLHFDLVVIDSTQQPIGRVLVCAIHFGKALRKASRLHPGCTFQPLGTLEGYAMAQEWMDRMLQNDNPFMASMDLRS